MVVCDGDQEWLNMPRYTMKVDCMAKGLSEASLRPMAVALDSILGVGDASHKLIRQAEA
jgi:hypothetical protein